MADNGPIPAASPAPGEAQMLRLQAAGYSQQELTAYKARTTGLLAKAGFGSQDVSSYWGDRPPAFDQTAVSEMVKGNQARAIAPGAVPVKDPIQAFEAGWDMSVSGLMMNKGLAKKYIDPKAGIISQIFNAVGQQAGDLPVAVPGAVGGGVAGTAGGALVPGAGETGTSEVAGGLLGGGFGWNAAPEAARQSLIISYRRNELKTWDDVMKAGVDGTVETIKSGTIGAVSNLTGGKAGAFVEKKAVEWGLSKASGKWSGGLANAVSQAGTSATISAGMEGRLPNARDFTVGALLAVGVHQAGHFVGGRFMPSKATQRVQKNMEDIYVRTGMTPQEQWSRAQHDPVFKQEIMTQDVNGEPVHPAHRAAAAAEPPYPKPVDDTENAGVMQGITTQMEQDEAMRAEGTGSGQFGQQGAAGVSPANEIANSSGKGTGKFNTPTEAEIPATVRHTVSGPGVQGKGSGQFGQRGAAGMSPANDIAGTAAKTAGKFINSTPVKAMVAKSPGELAPIIKNIETPGLKNPDAAVSPKGAVGRYQIMPGTARQYGFDPSRLHEPAYNAQVMDAITRDLYRRYRGNTNAVLIGYNAGPGRASEYLRQGPGTGLKMVPDKSVKGGYRYERINVDRDESKLPLETQKYLARARMLSGGKLPEGTAVNLDAGEIIGGGTEDITADMQHEQDVLELTKKVPVEDVSAHAGDATSGDLSAANRWKGASVDDLTDELLSLRGEQPQREYMNNSTMRRQVFSELAPLRDLDTALVKAGKLDRAKDMGFEDWGRQTYGSESRAQVFARYGELDFATKTINREAPTLPEIAKEVFAKGGDRDGWVAYMLAKRALEKSQQIANPALYEKVMADISSAKLNQSIELGAIDQAKAPKRYAKVAEKWKTHLGLLDEKLTEAKAGIDIGVNLAAAKEMAQNPEAIARYEEATQKFRDQNNGVLRYYRDGGMISPEAYDRMVAGNASAYVSIRRIMGDNTTGTKRGFGVRNTLYRMEGSDRKFLDPLLATIDNQRLMVQMADRNAFRGKLIEAAKADPEIAAMLGLKEVGKVDPNYDEVDGLLKQYGFTDEQLPQAREQFGSLVAMRQEKALGDREFLYFDKGVAKRFQVGSPEMAALLRGADAMGEVGPLLHVFKTVAAVQRTGIVGMPDFGPRLIFFWHQLNQWLMDPLHPPPFKTWLDGIGHVLKRDEQLQDLMANGGLGAALVGMDRDGLARDLDRVFTETGTWDKVWNTVKHPLEFAQILNETIDTGNRVGYKKFAEGKGIDPIKAATMARKAGIDYHERATSQLVNTLAQIIPFFRPHLLGMKQGWESVAEQKTKGGKAMTIAGLALKPTAALMSRGFMITAIAAGLYVLCRKQDEDLPEGERYEDLPRWERDRMMITPQINGVRLKLRMPANFGILFHGLPIRMMDAMYAHDKKAFDKWGDDFLDEFMVPMVPPLVGPPAEVATNRNFFSMKPLVPDSVRERAPDLQYTENTTEVAKQLAKYLGYGTKALGGDEPSPIQVEHLITGYTGPMGAAVLRTINAPLDKEWHYKDISDNPFLHGFVVRHPGMNAQPIQDFYETYHDFTQQKGSFTFLRRQAANRGQHTFDTSAVNLAEAQAAGPLGSISKVLSLQRGIIDGIRNDKTMTVDEKRQHIETVYSHAVTVASYGNAVMDVIEDRNLTPNERRSELQQIADTWRGKLAKLNER
jgi:hypothetical protein